MANVIKFVYSMMIIFVSLFLVAMKVDGKSFLSSSNLLSYLQHTIFYLILKTLMLILFTISLQLIIVIKNLIVYIC
jgi:membrane-anchored glycerophosphoryl diester phosphodiesterase (GDPDase)